MADQSPPKRAASAIVRWLLAAAMLLGGASYVFRHSLFPGTPEAGAEVQTLPAMAVTVATAERREISRRIAAGGTLVARDEILIVAQLQVVLVESYLADVGDWVTKGQSMAVLDSQRLDLQLSQKSADLAKAAAAIAQAQAQSVKADASAAGQRAKSLREGGTILVLALEEKETAAAVAAARAEAQRQALIAAKADLARVKAEHAELQWQREQVTVRASASGVISERNAKMGQTTAGDGSPLFRILMDGDVELEALVIETALPAIRVGQAAALNIAGTDSPVYGKVRQVSPSVDPATRMGKVWISLPGKAIKPGSFASATLEADPHQAIAVPRTAVLPGADGPRVRVVHNSVVMLRQVRTGLADAGGIEIVSGLQPDEIVVASAGGFLREGSKVSPTPLPIASAGEGF